jgi:hypothetical protein
MATFGFVEGATAKQRAKLQKQYTPVQVQSACIRGNGRMTVIARPSGRAVQVQSGREDVPRELLLQRDGVRSVRPCCGRDGKLSGCAGGALTTVHSTPSPPGDRRRLAGRARPVLDPQRLTCDTAPVSEGCMGCPSIDSVRAVPFVLQTPFVLGQPVRRLMSAASMTRSTRPIGTKVSVSG